LNCDYIIKGETEEEILRNGAEHAIKAHSMKMEDIYLDRIATNFLCHAIGKLSDK
jgi:predicted small metal-binding protein